MSAERVEKGWQVKGLEAYPTAAILGTLRHYGVGLDEAGFRDLAKEKFPLAIAEQWHGAWKGTGQFAPFPMAAADALWRRLESDRLPPADLSLAVAQLITALEAMKGGSPDAPVGERFKSVDALMAKVPLDAGKPVEKFVAEVLFHLGDWAKAFGQLGAELVAEGHLDDAEEFARLEGKLFPARAGVAIALLRSAKGEKVEAIADLDALAARAEVDRETRLGAVDGLIQLDALAQAKERCLPLLDEAEKAKDFHFGLEVGQRLMHVLEKPAHGSGRKELLDRIGKLAEAHAQAHPHH